MRVLVACEFSGVVRDAFGDLGHDAWSCDLLPCERGGKHIQDDVRVWLGERWDLIVAHPPCTLLTRAGARWWGGKEQQQDEAIRFVQELADVDTRTAVENPIGILSSRWRKPDQIIQPWMFGHGEVKATCLWLKGLPKLAPTEIVSGREPRVHWAAPGPERWKERSRTLSGIAAAMAQQWGGAVRA